jgi:hypothetical protein
MSVFWDVSPFIALMMEAVGTSEKLVYFNESTRRCSPEDCHLVFAAVRI